MDLSSTQYLLSSLGPLLAVLAIALALLAVWIYWMVSRARLRRQEQPSEEVAEEQADTEPPEPAAVTAIAEPPPFRPPSPDQPPEDIVEVFRVMRDLADGSLVVEIGGRRYSRLTEITDGQVGRRFLANVQALAEFAMLSAARPSSPMPPLPTPEPPSMPEPPPLAERLRAAISQPPPPPKPSAIPGTPPAGESTFPQGGSLVDQIEDMLQYRLMTNPALSKRSIHVRPGPHGGVHIEVDGRFFDGVGEVDDDEVRAFIQDTIREWEARQ